MTDLKTLALAAQQSLENAARLFDARTATAGAMSGVFREKAVALAQFHAACTPTAILALIDAAQPAPGEFGEPMPLRHCPPGLFMFGGCLGFRSEYRTNDGWPDAYVVESGEYFWGGAETHPERAKLLVRPLDNLDALARDHAALVAERDRLREACAAFVEWLDSDEHGPTYPEGTDRSWPGNEAVWQRWWNSQHVLCARAMDLARAALAKGA